MRKVNSKYYFNNKEERTDGICQCQPDLIKNKKEFSWEKGFYPIIMTEILIPPIEIVFGKLEYWI
jgi:hypothetical protein